MTPDERQSLQTLLSQLVAIRNLPKDAEAQQMISQAVAQQPDAAYLLVQRTMILEQALEAAKQQISELQSQSHSSRVSQSSFLDANAWGRNAASPRNTQETSAMGTPLSSAGGKHYPAGSANAMRGRASGFLGGGGGNSMLGTLAATAAGVAGGAFLFHGIGNLLGDKDQAASPDQAADTNNDTAPAEDNLAAQDNTDASSDVPADDPLAGDFGLDDGSFEA